MPRGTRVFLLTGFLLTCAASSYFWARNGGVVMTAIAALSFIATLVVGMWGPVQVVEYRAWGDKAGVAELLRKLATDYMPEWAALIASGDVDEIQRQFIAADPSWRLTILEMLRAHSDIRAHITIEWWYFAEGDVNSLIDALARSPKDTRNCAFLNALVTDIDLPGLLTLSPEEQLQAVVQRPDPRVIRMVTNILGKHMLTGYLRLKEFLTAVADNDARAAAKVYCEMSPRVRDDRELLAQALSPQYKLLLPLLETQDFRAVFEQALEDDLTRREAARNVIGWVLEYDDSAFVDAMFENSAIGTVLLNRKSARDPKGLAYKLLDQAIEFRCFKLNFS